MVADDEGPVYRPGSFGWESQLHAEERERRLRSTSLARLLESHAWLMKLKMKMKMEGGGLMGRT